MILAVPKSIYNSQPPEKYLRNRRCASQKYSTVLLTIQHNIETFFRNLPPLEFSLSVYVQDLVTQESIGVNSTAFEKGLI